MNGSPKKSEATPPKRPSLPELWQLLIECRDEKDQEKLYRELQKRGYRCLRIDTVVSCPVRPSFRVSQVQGMFDLPCGDAATERFSVELPDDNEPWQIGLIVGPSGSGKTTVARAAFGALAPKVRWPRDRAVVDSFGRHSIKEITAMLTAVGFSSPPAWVKPYRVLSQGERFRCDLARALLTGKPRVVFDEFTSVVDRTVARIGAAAVAKAVRQMWCGRPACESKQFVAVTCHYDVAQWLEPDWVLDMADGMSNVERSNDERNDECRSSSFVIRDFGIPSTFDIRHSSLTARLQWRRLRRPPLHLRLYRTTADAWPMFARHHYLTAALNRSAHCYVGLLEGVDPGGMSNVERSNDERMTKAQMTNGKTRHSTFGFPSTFDIRHSSFPDPRQPVAFAAILSAIGRCGVWRVSRLVVLPDYQGVGIGRAMLSAVAEQYPRLRITTSHPAMLRALAADPAWHLAVLRRAGYTRQPHATAHAGFRGGAIRATSAGRCVATFERKKPAEK